MVACVEYRSFRASAPSSTSFSPPQAAAASQTQTDLAQRVSGWRARVHPALALEDERPPFDIHQYGQMVLSGIVKSAHRTASSASLELDAFTGRPFAFAELVADQPRCDASLHEKAKLFSFSRIRCRCARYPELSDRGD